MAKDAKKVDARPLCKKCDGKGFDAEADRPCASCDGSGRQSKK